MQADEIIDRLRRSGALRDDLEWTGDGDFSVEVAATLGDLINEQITEDSATTRLEIAGLDMSETNLDYLASLFENEVRNSS